MITKTVTLGLEDFFHARPAAQIAAVAKTYESVLMIMLGTEIAEAKNPMALMRLGHPKGAPLEIWADGSDEEAALKAVLEVIKKEFFVKEL
ncbi:MAG: HPr family phosphocarrier protein [Lachnospiraceae bacterium]|nr:HPr family phosphocarrier protein [Lachnospiraceae bacterium]